jgi:hypothetical protein
LYSARETREWLGRRCNAGLYQQAQPELTSS